VNKKQWIMLISITILLIFIIGICAFFFTPKEDAKTSDNKFITTSNDNENVIKDQTIDGLKISNVMLVVKDEGSSFSADVTNITNEEIKGKTLEIMFKTSTNKKIISLVGYFGNSIKPGETKQINTNTGRRLTKNIIKSIEYKLV